MDELTRSWLVDETGEIDEGAATDTRTVDCLGGGGAVDEQAELEVTVKALKSLIAHGVVEDMEREDAVNFTQLTTRWENGWRMKGGEWKMKVRCVARECKWAKHREDLFSLGATHSAGRVIDFIFKLSLETFEAYAVDAYFQALNTTKCSCSQQPSIWIAGQSWVEVFFDTTQHVPCFRHDIVQSFQPTCH